VKSCVLMSLGLLALSASYANVPNVAPDRNEPMYGCDHCTDAQYDADARSLGAGRHVLVDFTQAKPHVFEVSDALTPSDVLVKPVKASEREQAWFELARRLWTSASPVRFSEAELEIVLWQREVDRTVENLVLAEALRYDLLEAMDKLLPAIAPTRYASTKTPASLRKPESMVVKQAPDEREVVVELARGRVEIIWTRDKSAIIAAVVDENGKNVSLPDSNDFSHGKVYLYEGDAHAKAHMASFMRSHGFKVDVKDNGAPFECIRKVEDIVCRDVRVESRRLVGLMD
jgi:hypothetical protein